ncbi:hypothetical protein OCK02_19405 [Rhizobium sp. TRM96647]|uniref:hypothetical protein n=1 Tax=unclassified Rhizobium TaxID=2613769 RepID=UPI0021E7AED6|nr:MULTISPECIES: hypothetical protein [unclassified Rhizobium]MCV3738377.1 hypothetical protein [Rhizobium sp. TRM96647]MCV3759874.1 hypothetical protein [Rhizobium sp. TRM96650]
MATEGLEPEAIRVALAAFAKRSVSEIIASGRASPRFERYVNSRRGLPEEAVQLPGPIVYEFSLWEPIITFALEELRKRSPVKSGRFRNSFIVIVRGAIVTNFDGIGAEDEVIITNFQPYIRKAEGGVLSTKRFAIFDGTKRALARAFGNEGRNSSAFSFETRWLEMGSGLHPAMPYILKGSGAGVAAKTSNRSSAFRAGRTTLAPRRDRQADMPITYPAVVINQV